MFRAALRCRLLGLSASSHNSRLSVTRRLRVVLSATGVWVFGDPVTLDVLATIPDTVLLPPGLHWSTHVGGDITLGNLLVRLGHHCRGRCPSEPFSLDGLICVIPRRQLPGSVALVMIDFTHRPEPPVELFRVLRAVNSCVRLDRIRVVPGDGGGE